MKISIITVNYNNPDGLERTIRSIISQTSKDYEYIIVDGASTKGDIEIIKRYDNGNIKWLSEKDTGIYNAMNKGVILASGEYCLFINSGDELFSNTTLEELQNCNLQADFIQGVIARPGKKIKFVKPPKEEDITLGWYYWGNNNFHQASIIKRQMLLEHPYDETMKYSADMKFNVECLIKYNCSYQNINVVVALYEYGGVSVTAQHLDEDYKLFDDLFGNRITADYQNLMYIHRFPVNRIMPILRKFGMNKWLKLYLEKKNKR